MYISSLHVNISSSYNFQRIYYAIATAVPIWKQLKGIPLSRLSSALISSELVPRAIGFI